MVEKVCSYCGGELKSVNWLFKLDGEEAYQKFKEGFKKETGLDWKESPNKNCCECGMIYNELDMPTGNIIQWFPQLKAAYKKFKEVNNEEKKS